MDCCDYSAAWPAPDKSEKQILRSDLQVFSLACTFGVKGATTTCAPSALSGPWTALGSLCTKWFAGAPPATMRRGRAL